jgi:hypothetical protein
VLFLVGIVAAVIGLKLVPHEPGPRVARAPQDPAR